jgi:hypothetical protein
MIGTIVPSIKEALVPWVNVRSKIRNVCKVVGRTTMYRVVIKAL